MSKIYFVESELCPRIQFCNESDRNEMALSLWQEQIYFLWARTVNWYEDGIFTGIEEDAAANVFTWEGYDSFERPTQVAFWDMMQDRYLGGIAYDTEIICGCCGGIVEIVEVYEFAPRGVIPIVVYDDWAAIDDFIISDNERHFEFESEENEDEVENDV